MHRLVFCIEHIEAYMKKLTFVALFTLAVTLQAQNVVDIIPDSVPDAGEIRFHEPTGWTIGVVQYVGLKAPVSIASNFVLTLPDALPGTDPSCLQVTGAGVIQYVAGVCSTSGSGLWTDNTTNISPIGGVTEAVAIGTVTELAKLTVEDGTGKVGEMTQTGVTNSQILALNFTGGNVGTTSAGSALLRVTSNSNFRPLASFDDAFIISATGNIAIAADSVRTVFSTSLRPASIWGDLINAEEFQLENAAHTGHFVFKFVDLNTELQFLDTVGAEILTFQAGVNRIEFHDTLVPSGGIDIGMPGLAFATLFVNSVGNSGFFPAVFANALDVNSITNSIDILLNRTMVAGTPNVTALGSGAARFDGFFDVIDVNSCVGCASAAFYQTMRDAGVAETQRAALNFVSLSMVLTDDVVGGETEFTILSSPANASQLVGTARFIGTTSPLTGGGDLSLNRTLDCSTCAVTNVDNSFSVEQTMPNLNLTSSLIEFRGIGNDYFADRSSSEGLIFGRSGGDDIVEIQEISTVLNEVRFQAGSGASDDIMIRLVNSTAGNGFNILWDQSVDQLIFETHSGADVFAIDASGISNVSTGNATIYIGSGSLYLRTFTGSDASCGGVADTWIGYRSDTDEIQVCNGGALKKVALI